MTGVERRDASVLGLGLIVKCGSLLGDPILVLAFGYGKRVCPGRHFVDATLFITVASLLSVFNVEKGAISRGQPFEYTYTGSVIRFAD